jgi:hypothetical protein
LRAGDLGFIVLQAGASRQSDTDDDRQAAGKEVMPDTETRMQTRHMEEAQ